MLLFLGTPVIGQTGSRIHIGAIAGYQSTRLTATATSGPSAAQTYSAGLVGAQISLGIARRLTSDLNLRLALADGLSYFEWGVGLTFSPRRLGPYGRIGAVRMSSSLSGACLTTIACAVNDPPTRWGLSAEVGHALTLSQQVSWGPMLWYAHSFGGSVRTRNVGLGLRVAGY